MQSKPAAIAERIASDPHTPHYHFIAPESSHWPFDPNGAIFWNDRYHLFYIFQDPDLPHAGHCWGHASSEDLLHWTYHPTALIPDEVQKGIFSGCALLDKSGRPVLVYHGVDAGTCIATPEDDELIVWRKSPNNPVIPMPAEGDTGWGVYRVFDPHVWLQGDTYHAILGDMVKPYDIRDTVYLFTSKDLIHWAPARQFYNPNPHWTGEDEDCACPDFFQIGDRHMLLCISHTRGARYYLGRYDNGTFIPEEHHRMNWPGGSCFAPESLLDDSGRRIMWAWVINQMRVRADQGYAQIRRDGGVMTLPRVLSLDEVGQVRIEPPIELDTLRTNAREYHDLTIDLDQVVALDRISGDVMEVAVIATVPDGAVFELQVRVSPDTQELTRIVFDRAHSTLSIDNGASSLDSRVSHYYPIGRSDYPSDVPVQTAPFALHAGERLELRVYLDASIMEVFANGRQCVTGRIYPTRADSTGVRLMARRAATTVHSVVAWDMASANSASTESA